MHTTDVIANLKNSTVFHVVEKGVERLENKDYVILKKLDFDSLNKQSEE